MARKAVSCKVQARLDNGIAVVTNHAFPSDPINGATTATDQAALDTAVTANEAAVAVLEADAASPTQAHVNSMRTTWNAVKTARTTLEADIGTVPGQTDVVISYNATTVVSKATLRQAIEAMLAMLPNTL